MFLIYIFLHQQRKQCLEFALPKLREICKYLAGACNSSSHARGLHYLTFVCETKQGKSMQWGESFSEKCFRKAQRYLSSLKWGEVPCKLNSLHLPPKNHNLFVKFGSKRELDERKICDHKLIIQNITHRGGECEKRVGGGAAPLHSLYMNQVKCKRYDNMRNT